jgi:hypothetical protein
LIGAAVLPADDSPEQALLVLVGYGVWAVLALAISILLWWILRRDAKGSA